jgi:hypothetical protein
LGFEGFVAVHVLSINSALGQAVLVGFRSENVTIGDPVQLGPDIFPVANPVSAGSLDVPGHAT